MQGEEGNLNDEGEDEQEGTGQQGKEEEPVDAEESSKLELPDDLQLDDEGNEGEGGESFTLQKILEHNKLGKTRAESRRLWKKKY